MQQGLRAPTRVQQPLPTVAEADQQAVAAGEARHGFVTSFGSRVVTFLDCLSELATRPWCAYPALLLLQLKVMWGDWIYRDLTPGDTSSHFLGAYGWYRDFDANIIWSPLYTSFYGSLLHLSRDVYVVTELHRLISVLVAALLVLTVMRRLLPHAIAWGVAAWWTLLETAFNAMYEIHPFSLIPVLVGILVLSSSTRPWARGVAVALLLTLTLLLRHELLLATGILAVLCLAWELRTVAVSSGTRAALARTVLASYAVPLLVAAPVVGFFTWETLRHDHDIRAYWEAKTDWTFCQFHALAYVEFRSDWKLNPWTECHQLLQDRFGAPSVTVLEALRRNPAAMVDHATTNLYLLPRGVQVALFNATSGSVSPDVVPVPLRSRWALASSVALLVLIAAGALVLYRDRRYWWQHWLRARVWGWVGLASLAVSVVLSMLIVRPRPEYLYPVALLLMAGAGMSVAIICSIWSTQRYGRALTLVLVAGVLLLAPMHYAEYFGEGGRTAKRPLLRDYRRIDPFYEAIARPGAVFVKGHYADDISHYVFKGQLVRVLEYHGLGEALQGNRSVEAFLDEKGATFFYIDDDLVTDLKRAPVGARFLTAPEAAGWEVIHAEDAPGSRWMLLRRSARS